MKKLFGLLFITLLFTSCADLMEKNARKKWDKDDIAFENNSDLIPMETTDEYGTYTKTGFKRLGGTTGIVGEFVRSTIDSSNLNKPWVEVERYIFNDDGTYVWSHKIQKGTTVTKNFKVEGKYKIFKYNKDYYLFGFMNSAGAMFYKVSDLGLEVYSSITVERKVLADTAFDNLKD